VATYPVLEHRAGRTSRWLRAHRVRIAFLAALAETALVIADVLQWRWALVIAGIIFAFHFFVGRRSGYASVRQLSWTAAVSQTLPVLVPFIAVLLGTLVVLGIVVAAFVVLALVILGRR
jgi:hypothetical protein